MTICCSWPGPMTSPARASTTVLEIVGLSEVARQKAGKYSLGMGQRLGIAGALLGDPGVLLFDEPINGLDPEGIRWARYLFRDLAAEGRTVFVSSHLINEMSLTAERLVVIGRGSLIAETTVGAFAYARLARRRAAGDSHGELVPRRARRRRGRRPRWKTTAPLWRRG